MSKMNQRSLTVFPGGSNGEFNLPAEMAMVIDHGRGCELWDTDGRRYLDFSMGWGSVLVGHAHPEVVRAVTSRAPQGSNFAYITHDSLKLAEELVQLSPACDQVRFCASGTEATMYGQRLARAYTGRSKILKFEGAYHGANEVGVTSLFPSGNTPFPKPEPSSAGIEWAVENSVLVAPFNDLTRTAEIIKTHATDLAAVVVEPLQRCVPPEPGFLEGLRSITQEHDMLLLFDEVVTGFRLAYGGAQQYYGVVPDLIAYGKALGGGYPIGVFGGRSDIMELVREDRANDANYVWVASTLGGNPISSCASLAVLSVLRAEGVYEHLHSLGRYLRDRMRQTLADQQTGAQVIGDGPLAQVVFATDKVVDYRSSRRGDSIRARALMLELFRRGIFLNPMGTKLYLSIEHDEAACNEFIEHFSEALKVVLANERA